MKRFYPYFAAAGLSLFIISCSKSNEADLTDNPGPGGNNNGCDTANMKFAANIKPILVTNCYACHSNANFAISGVKLEDYTDLNARVSNGDILGVITHADGYPAMPQGGPKLSECNINKIRSWINHGALNN